MTLLGTLLFFSTYLSIFVLAGVKMRKIDFIHCKVDAETKKKLKEKANNSKLNLTGFIEKVANEDIIFLDDNVRKLLQALKFQPKPC